MFKSTLLTTLILCLCCTGLQAQQTDGEVCEVKPKKAAKPANAWPKYAKMRFVEDYSHVADAKPRDVFDSLKHISLGDDPDWYVSFGGQARLRFEHYQNFNFGRPASNDDGYLLQRYFLHADLHMGKLFRIFAEMRSAWATDWGLTNPTAPHPTGFHDEFDIMNLFGELNFDLSDDLHSTIRAGRWEMNYGMGRMIGCRDWSQTRRPFDGASIRLAKGKNWIDGFWAKWVETHQYEAFNSSDEDIASWGVYAHLAKGALPFNTELYLLGKDNTTGSRDDHRISTGLRFFGDIAKTNFTFDIEGAYQFDYEGTDVEAGFFAAELTYKFKQ
ncbi:MAG: alginate export family protein, partial [Phycisphaeraceae bacterium JB051]